MFGHIPVSKQRQEELAAMSKEALNKRVEELAAQQPLAEREAVRTGDYTQAKKLSSEKMHIIEGPLKRQPDIRGRSIQLRPYDKD